MRYSVVLPAHRADAFLLEAIRSVESAIAADDAELIIVVNGAEREYVMATIREENLAETTRVLVSEISSLSYCLNKGIEAARGEFIARFDSDDLCLRDRFTTQYNLAVTQGLDFLFSDAYLIDKDGNQTGRNRASLNLWRKCGAIHPTAFIRRDVLLLLGGYGNLEFSEDYHLWLRAQAKGCKLAVDHHPAILYRVHANQATERSRLVETFATNIGVKLMVGLRSRRFSIIIGAIIDAIFLVYRKCISAFS